MFKNTASQKIAVFAFDVTTSVAKTGDAANLTAYVAINHGAVTVLGDTSATEMSATNAPGWYLFDLTQGETNGDELLFTGKSSTANVSMVGRPISTLPALFTTLSVDASGRVDVGKVLGTTQTARDLGAQADATTSSRMASYTQPTGFLAATFPATVASTTNISAGTIAAVSGAVGSVTGNVGGNVTGSVGSVVAAVAITSNIKKNQALASFEFLMTDSTTHAPTTGKTVTCTRSIDGGAFAAGTLASVAEVSNGIYKVSFGAGDLNGNVIVMRATATACDDAFERIVTQP